MLHKVVSETTNQSPSLPCPRPWPAYMHAYRIQDFAIVHRPGHNLADRYNAHGYQRPQQV
jgi:hypothetical protein